MIASGEFLGRRRELKVLEESYHSGESAFIPIYGRRRVGKSELILQFLRGKAGIYHLGKMGPAELQIRDFLQTAADVLDEPLLASVPADDWKTALQTVVGRWKSGKKLVLVLDEFQWTAEASAELPSVLQECWDRHWKRTGKVMLILCGSYVGFMERKVLGKESPLFGRRTGQILLKPFSYLDAAEFHPHLGLVERAKTYFLCGGIPQYLRSFSAQHSVERNIVDNFLSEYAPLGREPEFLLREELREVDNYYAVLLAVASGFTSYHDIVKRAGVSDRSLHYYLQQLAELGYVNKRLPLSGRRASPRQVRYAIGDPLLRFWFRFVYPNNSLIAQLGGERALQTRIRPELEAYFGACFEALCREALPHLYAREGVTGAFEVGEYWDQATQIDVVGVRDDGWTDLGECKWGPVRSPAKLAAELEEKLSRYPNPRNTTLNRRVFTRDRLRATKGKAGAVQWHCLEDLYRL